MKSLKKISFLLSFFLLFSCAESLDTSQLDDFVSEPIITSALTFFTAVPGQFFDATGVQQNTITDISEFKGFEKGFVRDNVVKLDFNAEIKNEFDRDVTIQVEFLNVNNFITYSFTPIVVSDNDLDFKYLEEIIIASNPNILTTTQVRISAEIENTGTQMNPSDTSEFEFKSAITFYIESGL